jgi:hypothetical protein
MHRSFLLVPLSPGSLEVYFRTPSGRVINYQGFGLFSFALPPQTHRPMTTNLKMHQVSPLRRYRHYSRELINLFPFTPIQGVSQPSYDPIERLVPLILSCLQLTPSPERCMTRSFKTTSSMSEKMALSCCILVWSAGYLEVSPQD